MLDGSRKRIERVVEQDVILPDCIEDRPRLVSQLGRRSRDEWRISELRYVHRGQPHQITEIEQWSGLDQIRLGQGRHFRGLILENFGEYEVTKLRRYPMIH